ncbi:MAG: deoxyribodipyrimidine photo-lyase [Chloroflexota bacterium]
MTTAIWWIRRDLRLFDNQPLHVALAAAEEIVPVFIFDPALLASPYRSDNRLAFLLGGLRSLAETITSRGGQLIVRHGEPLAELKKLQTECNASAIFAEADHSPYAKQRDKAIAAELPLHLITGLTVHAPDAVLKDDGTPYVVFTPYSRAWKSRSLPHQHDLLPAPERLSVPSDLASDPIPAEPTLPESVPFPPGEAEAQQRLAAFTTGQTPSAYSYGDRRDRPDLSGTSRLSPYFRFGMLSARQATALALKLQAQADDEVSRKSATTWLNELIWREFYVTILYHFPHVRSGSFRSELSDIQWNNDEAEFAAWCDGQTGYPIVDAAMRQLKTLGWMHNRARMITASFLIKDLLVDWRWGERWFMQQLVDGDPAANNGGWQWTAGTGTDAAPYFRVFNPTLQSKKFDPNGNYIRRWIPELAKVPTKFIHEPDKMSPREQQQVACVIGQDYPKPIVDHAFARKRVLEVYKQAKEGIVQPKLL